MEERMTHTFTSPIFMCVIFLIARHIFIIVLNPSSALQHKIEELFKPGESWNESTSKRDCSYYFLTGCQSCSGEALSQCTARSFLRCCWTVLTTVDFQRLLLTTVFGTKNLLQPVETPELLTSNSRLGEGSCLPNTLRLLIGTTAVPLHH